MTNADPPDDSGPPARGRWFDEFRVGEVFTTAERTLTVGDIETFAALTGDANPLHLDDEAARRAGFRGRVAHGMLVESIATGLTWQSGLFLGTIAALARVERKFLSPVLPGDTIRLRLEVTELDESPKPRRGRVGFAATVLNQRDEPVIEGAWEAVIGRKREERGPRA